VAAPKLSRRRLGRSAGSRRLNLSAELWRHVEAQPAWRRRSSRRPSPTRLVFARLVFARLGQVRREGDHLRPVLRRVLEVDGRLSVGEDEQLELVVPPRRRVAAEGRAGELGRRGWRGVVE